MIDASALCAFLDALAQFPIDWVLWALDADETYVCVEGSCLARLGMCAGNILGRPLGEVASANPEVMAWARRSMRAPATDQVVVGGHPMVLSGAPSRDGGCVGIGMLLETPRAADPPASCPVVELTGDVPRIGARRGDLLVVDPDCPGRVGLYREIDADLLPAELEAQVGKLSSTYRAERTSRPAHLRLLP